MSGKVSTLVRAILVARFPAAFAEPGQPKRPLVTGLHAAIYEACPDLKRWQVRQGLADYCGGPTYLRSIVEGAERINLEGEARGYVTAGQAAHAATVLAKLHACWLARNAAKAAHIERIAA